MRFGAHLVATAVIIAIGAIGCGLSETGEPIFGTADTTCSSVMLTNAPTDEVVLGGVVDCLLAEIEAGRPVTVDIAAATVEGDPIYHRYAFDGDEVLIVEDSRADEYGSDGVRAGRARAARRAVSTSPGRR